jgi:hypothetical protein
MTTKISIDNIQESALAQLGGSGGGVTAYATIAELPLTGNNSGSMAFVSQNNRLYIWNGVGWFNIALINTSPTITQGPNPSYLFATNGTPIVITLLANDPEGIPITWSAQVTSGTLGNTATITQNNNVFTITPSTNEANAGTFGVTFTASDGVNIATAVSSFTLAFGGQQVYTTPGTYQFIAPANTISVVCVGGGGCGDDGVAGDGGGGGGGGGGLAYVNTMSVVVGQTYTVVVGTGGANGNGYGTQAQSGTASSFSGTHNSVAFSITANGGEGGRPYNQEASPGGTFSFTSLPPNSGSGGGAGGGGGRSFDGGGGGGGAGGYNGQGGNGSGSNSGREFTVNINAIGTGGGGGGGAHLPAGLGLNGGGNGGAGQSNITGGGGGGANIFSTQFPAQNGQNGNGLTSAGTKGGNGGFPGGGGGGSWDNGLGLAAPGANGAVRIIWGTNRIFPTNANDL